MKCVAFRLPHRTYAAENLIDSAGHDIDTAILSSAHHLDAPAVMFKQLADQLLERTPWQLRQQSAAVEKICGEQHGGRGALDPCRLGRAARYPKVRLRRRERSASREPLELRHKP